MVRLPSVRLCNRWFILPGIAMAIMLGFALGASPAEAEMQIGLYGGWSESFDSDIHLSQPGGTNLTLSDVPWESESFAPPPYWGLRGTYWFNGAPSWGLMVDYNHAKVIADQSAIVSVSGTEPSPGNSFGEHFQRSSTSLMRYAFARTI